ncbi:MAG: response regulator transcription factor [Chloroflexi bacterium]|nr:response regulator transcription factor [Chloroflexota bacterium]MBT7081538.1 response regulator transcription factor [Chloroflexota bacterium]MBT7289359.1 response regulator transcription factor [Chloroflexota bacterium]
MSNAGDKIKVFLVDDHGLFRDGIRSLLSFHEDIEVIGEAVDGIEAVDKIPALAPDVVLLDIAMPNMNGLEVCRRLVKTNPSAKTVIVSQHTDKEYVITAVKIGAFGYVPKRAAGADLIAAIRTVYNGEYFLHPSVAKILVGDYRSLMDSDVDEYDNLTNREREILQLVAEGNTGRQIAHLLHISEKTVIGHRANLMQKLDIHNRADLIKYAIGKRLINIETPNAF